ncbi:UDP-galactose--LPS alpha1,2-galactosyltransferase WaaW [Vagococcus acidifermentans]|uniref:UDP-galactose--LPS alpha1,2-galactosyltransferase WaaW n=2 Tax=Vagococcus acidifermentans TaxID=564710 RepID=A0A430B0Y2_9ENTE|nr:UDP-galactose--LPS alpha1,2-galactosyltransferase WaaW [Vagococcus acidifermentans]
MNLLFAINSTFFNQLKTTLYSIFENNSHTFDIYVLNNDLTADQISELERFCTRFDAQLYPVNVPADWFADAPVSKRYPETIYYRLLAHSLLPQEVTRILYLDADILCINSLAKIYQTDVSDYLYAACYHPSVTGVTDTVNKIRLGTYENKGYYNSGVLLMNLENIRRTVFKEDVYRYIADNALTLLLPDQDVLNGLYGKDTLPLTDTLYNYDVRYYTIYKMLSEGEATLDWIMEHTVFLHYCGKNKPWQPKNTSKFAVLYKHYRQKALRI